MKTENELRQIGRDFAVDMLQQAVQSAKLPEQLNGQLHILNCAAVHILATNVFNQIKQMDKDQMTLVMDIKEQINDEIQALFEHQNEMEYVKPKNAEQ